MKFDLTEATVKELLNLKEWKEQVMTALETLQQEVQETKAVIATVGAGVSSLVARLGDVSAKLAEAVTPEQVAALKVQLDQAQADAQAIADSIPAPTA